MSSRQPRFSKDSHNKFITKTPINIQQKIIKIVVVATFILIFNTTQRTSRKKYLVYVPNMFQHIEHVHYFLWSYLKAINNLN